ncbi:MAG: DUF494 family protein [Candidatus Krumholzibacteriota bacterium]|nr:DUF494 family protein [Candidatus Krumholzibacteriota bacterium]
MNERIKQIIAYIMDPESIELKDPAMLQSELEDLGYSHDEIDQAMTLIDIDSLRVSGGQEPEFPARARVFGEAERMILSTDAQGYLLRLYRLGWLSEANMSLVIENAGMEYSAPVTVSEVREVATRYVADLPEESEETPSRRGGQVH